MQFIIYLTISLFMIHVHCILCLQVYCRIRPLDNPDVDVCVKPLSTSVVQLIPSEVRTYYLHMYIFYIDDELIIDGCRKIVSQSINILIINLYLSLNYQQTGRVARKGATTVEDTEQQNPHM